jgi:hypothetical protein
MTHTLPKKSPRGVNPATITPHPRRLRAIRDIFHEFYTLIGRNREVKLSAVEIGV